MPLGAAPGAAAVFGIVGPNSGCRVAWSLVRVGVGRFGDGRVQLAATTTATRLAAASSGSLKPEGRFGCDDGFGAGFLVLRFTTLEKIGRRPSTLLVWSDAVCGSPL